MRSDDPVRARLICGQATQEEKPSQTPRDDVPPEVPSLLLVTHAGQLEAVMSQVSDMNDLDEEGKDTLRSFLALRFELADARHNSGQTVVLPSPS